MGKVKKFGKRVAQRALLPSRSAILVASMGRSGSTLVYDTIRRSLAESLPMSTAWSWKLVGDVCWDISQIKPVGSVVYKTHDYAEFLPSTSRNNLKVVFVYGDVVEAVASVANQAEERGEVWLRSHYEHLRSDAKGYEDLFENDALGIERQLLSWSSVQGVDVCLISMSGLWDYQRELGRFLGLNLRFPKPRPRSSGTKRIVGEKGDIILDRYSGAVGIIENLPDFFIRRA